MANPPKEPAAAGAEAPKKKSKLMLIVAVAVVTLGAAGGGAWYFMRPADPNAPKVAHEAKPAAFLPLESFTVNLMGQDGQPQYLQAGLTLKLGEEVKTEVIKDRMPEIRNRILLVLSGKKAGELLPVSGKNKLALEIADAVKEVLGPAAAGKAPAHGSPAAGEAAAATATHAEEKAPAADAAKHAPPSAPAPIEVLFTSFIIQ